MVSYFLHENGELASIYALELLEEEHDIEAVRRLNKALKMTKKAVSSILPYLDLYLPIFWPIGRGWNRAKRLERASCGTCYINAGDQLISYRRTTTRSPWRCLYSICISIA